MGWKSKRREWHGVSGALGLVAGLAGFVGGLYPPGIAVFLMLAIWILGATLVNLLTDPPDRS